jgi:tight adherence protein B
MENGWIVAMAGVSSVGCLVYVVRRLRSADGCMNRRLEARLQALRARPATGTGLVMRHDPRLHSLWSRRLLRWMPGLGAWDRRLRQAGSSWPVSRLCGNAALIALGCALAGVLTGAPTWLWPVLALAGGALPFVSVSARAKRQADRFDQQLSDALELISRSLRAGMTLSAALSMVGSEFSAPLGPHFRQLSDELGYGASFGEAMDHLAANAPGRTLRYFISAVGVQHEVGGNLAELTTNAAIVLRQRLQMNDKVKALTAEGRLSAVLLTALPIGLLALLSFINRDYVSVFWRDPTGHLLLFGMFAMVLVGNLMMRRMTRIRY